MVLFALAAVLLAGLLHADAAVYSSLTPLVRHAQRKEAIQLKEEYHAFRDRAGVVLFAFAAALLARTAARGRSIQATYRPLRP